MNMSGLNEHALVTNNTLNSTSDLTLAKWTVLPVYSLLTLILGFIGNGTLLFLFFKDRTLRSPFNIYVINLLSANFLCLVIFHPMDIITNLYSSKWFMGNQACTVYLYALWILESAITNSHLLITINRIWAIACPISYRTYHTVPVAVLFCLGGWVFIHLTVGPGLVTDALYFRSPVKVIGCVLNTERMWIWTIIIQLIIFDLSHAIIILLLPIICLLKVKRRRIITQKVQLSASNKVHQAIGEEEQLKTFPSAKERRMTTTTTISQFAKDGPNEGKRNFGQDSRRSPTIQLEGQHVVKASKSGERSYGFLVLVLLTISVMICWVPGDVFYTIITFIDVDFPTFSKVSVVLGMGQVILDPLLFTLALPSLRKSLRSCRASFLDRE